MTGFLQRYFVYLVLHHPDTPLLTLNPLSLMEQHNTSDSVPVADHQSNLDGEKAQEQTSNADQLSSENVEIQEIGRQEYNYITGFKLAIVIFSLTMVFFLVMLDMSIITTVGQVLVR